MCIYIYIYIYNLPPLNKKTPHKKPHLGGGEQICVTIKLDGGTINPLIKNNDVWFDLPP